MGNGYLGLHPRLSHRGLSALKQLQQVAQASRLSFYASRGKPGEAGDSSAHAREQGTRPDAFRRDAGKNRPEACATQRIHAMIRPSVERAGIDFMRAGAAKSDFQASGYYAQSLADVVIASCSIGPQG